MPGDIDTDEARWWGVEDNMVTAVVSPAFGTDQCVEAA